MTACPECELAQTEPYHAVYMAGCDSCVLRHLSDVPHDIREQYVERECRDEAMREAMRTAIVAEYERRKTLIDEIARRALGLAA